METSQAYSRLLLNRVEANNKFLENWFSKVVYKMTGDFETSQKDADNCMFLAYSLTDGKPGYEIMTLNHISYSDYDYQKIVEHNYYAGQPIFAAIFCGKLQVKLENDLMGTEEDRDILFITLETELKKERCIYLKELNQHGVFEYKLNEMLSHNMLLPPEVNRLNYIIDCPIKKVYN